MEWIATFGQWVKHRRKSLDLTQEQLAQQVGCSPVTIKKIEANERRPSPQIALLLAGRLQISPEQSDVFVRVARGQLALDRLPAAKALALPAEMQAAARPSAAAPDQPTAVGKSIPVLATPLIGRERELAEIVRLVLDPQCRLLTLTGVGGTGKTRLALAAALQVRESYGDEVYIVPLAGVGSPSMLPGAIARSLGMSFSGPVETKLQLSHHLRDRKTLLVLDNLEHLLEGADLIAELLQNAPALTLLATSREQLRLQAEWVFEVRGLAVPESTQGAVVEASSAARLFVQIARQTQADFHLEDEDYPAIGRICQMVEGLPLALVLAARWTRVLSCADIAREIERDLEFLAASSGEVAPRDISRRHRSLQAVFDHSWDLLSGKEQQVSKQLSVFRGGFQREAAEQVAAARLAVLSALIDKSLLWRSSSNRYYLHPLVRQYLAARLAENEGEQAAVERRHSLHYLHLLQKSEASLRSEHQREALARLAADTHNISLAWHKAIEHGLFGPLNESATALYYVHELQQDFADALFLLRQAADAVRTRLASIGRGIHSRERSRERSYLEITLARLLNFEAFFSLRQGNNHEALALFETSLSLLRTILGSGPLELEAHARFAWAFGCVHLGVVCWALGEFEQAARHITEGLESSSQLEHSWLRGLALGLLGGVTHDRGDYVAAYDYLHEATQLLAAGGDPYLTMLIGTYYSRTLLALDRLEEAHAWLQEALPGVRTTGNRWLIALGLEYLARVARLSGNDGEASDLLAESLQLHRDIGDPWSLTLALLEMSRQKLEGADFAAAEQHAMEALHMTAGTGNVPTAMEGLGVLATICAEQGLDAEAFCLAGHVFQHPASKQDTRQLAEELQARILATQSSARQEAAQKIGRPVSLDVLMQQRFGFRLPATFS